MCTTNQAELHRIYARSMTRLFARSESTRADPAESERVRRAVERIRSRRYGFCIRCGTFMPESQLMADPCRERCVDCEFRSQQNRGSARPGRGAARMERRGPEDREIDTIARPA